MTDAKLEHVPPDPREALTFLAQARKFFKDSKAVDVSDPGRQVLLHNAATSAADAVLLAAGLRVSRGDKAHALRLESAVDVLGEDDELYERLDDARMNRNDVSYRAAMLPEATVAEARGATEQFLEAATAYVEGRGGDE